MSLWFFKKLFVLNNYIYIYVVGNVSFHKILIMLYLPYGGFFGLSTPPSWSIKLCFKKFGFWDLHAIRIFSELTVHGVGMKFSWTTQKITQVYNQVHILYLKCRLFEYWLTSTACCQWCSVGDKVILDIQCTFVEQSNSEPCQQLSSSFQLWIYPGNLALGENAPFHSHLETKLKEMITNKT